MVYRSKIFHKLIDSFWNGVCSASLIGIWPRFIEPGQLSITRLTLPLPGLSKDLHGLTLAQFSDLHFSSRFSSRFAQKILKAMKELQPDITVFTGDFLCYGQLENGEGLLNFLKNFSAPYGCYAILGNHDYAEAVSFNEQGDYDVIKKRTPPALKALKRIFFNLKPSGKVSERAKNVALHSDLLTLLKKSPFQLLHNEAHCIRIGSSAINICGLGEYMLGRCQPSEAFQQVDPHYPTIILAHNPDSLSLIAQQKMAFKQNQGSLILSGHTHGGQVNLPFFWKRFVRLENMRYGLSSLYRLNPLSNLYVSRGIGSILRFRFRSPPEIVFITLEASDKGAA